MFRRLLHIEQIKLLNYTPFRIVMAIYMVAIALGLLIYPAVDDQIPVISLSDLFRFPDVWLFLTWVTQPYHLLLGLIVIMITTKEFNDHTFKTQLIFGLSRSQLLLQKIALMIILAVVATLLLGLTSLTLGLVHSYKLTFKIALDNSLAMLNYLLAAFAFMSLALLIAMAIKNTALSMLTFIALRVFVDPVLFLLLRKHEIRWALPVRSFTKLTPMPDLIEIFERKMNSPDSIEESALDILPKGFSPGLTMFLAILYTSLAIWGAWRILQRRKLG